jgi:hypothetical protein
MNELLFIALALLLFIAINLIGIWRENLKLGRKEQEVRELERRVLEKRSKFGF